MSRASANRPLRKWLPWRVVDENGWPYNYFEQRERAEANQRRLGILLGTKLTVQHWNGAAWVPVGGGGQR